MTLIPLESFELLGWPVPAGRQVPFDCDAGREDGIRGDNAARQDDHLDSERGPGTDQATKLLKPGVDCFTIDHHFDRRLVETVIGRADLRPKVSVGLDL